MFSKFTTIPVSNRAGVGYGQKSEVVKTGRIIVVEATLFLVVNNIVQHCYTCLIQARQYCSIFLITMNDIAPTALLHLFSTICFQKRIILVRVCWMTSYIVGASANR